MCGIAGWVNWRRNLIDHALIIENMRDTMTSRGPDASGIWLSESCAFGHRRLSVIDPEHGNQPMVYRAEGNTFVLCYNGEIYNAAELRSRLELNGYRFQTNCDTEVLLLACVEWGKAALDLLNGIFAFAFWNERDRSCLLARDRLGVKPLFFAETEDGLLFASEPKALLAHPEIEAEVTMEGMAEVWGIGPARTPGHGIFRQIEELRPGHWLECIPERTRSKPYWELKVLAHRDSSEKTAERVRELLANAVNRQLVSDVPLCTLLSGGLDSSALTALAVGGTPEEKLPFVTLSVDYEEQHLHFERHSFQPDRDEPYIRQMSQALRTEHHFIELNTESLLETLEAAVDARDVPGMADIDASLLLFCRRIRSHATVALSGEAADEVFGGYPWFHRPIAQGQHIFPWSTAIEFRARILNDEHAAEMDLPGYVSRRYSEAMDEAARLDGAVTVADADRPLFELSYLNITRFMPTLLDRKDRMSMACGLEVRVPFCDHELVQYAFNIPWAMKNYAGREKGILRLALAGLLPDDIVWRKKSPYPKTHHPLYTKKVSARILERLTDSSSPLRDWIKPETIAALARSPEANSKLPWFGQLMSGPQFFAWLLQLDYWLRTYRIRVVN